MKQSIDPGEKVRETGVAREPGYDAWKRAKVERAIAETKDRAKMIPIEQIVRDFDI